ncbi:dienelactone hydrolase endo-1,3,1,4-beta-D-glucanase [Dendrothele bispora CBS 962.96]|uniref:Dienelactone hydrolase endo-1,3,1,4-beta-D-glucanase n=1 Tax=Dendrothele bispora (strain CBS 962.96) TaxID=1314807 RepID=A0A4S8LHR9_DENBC|nr:dienelactone hydrolase endo-1,3,1,4-beta-D-glucanase [Dendrothele bispora CBS 962.96]THU96368.1 dienelactone hydrolase endo-1,3,1,4-beta-D-glucanase [Dendrothele bispora CBS 962.96]
MSLCEDCVKGVVHEGTPQGKWEEIGGVNCYVGTPTENYAKDKALLYLSDVFGPQLINAQLLVDSFAANGIKTIAPDYLNGDVVPPDALHAHTFDTQAWLARHGPEQTRPPLDAVITALKNDGINTLGATGYCFGAKYALELGVENQLKVCVMSHPGGVKIPDDMERYFSNSRAPLLVNSCEVDRLFTLEVCAEVDNLFGSGKFAPGYKRDHFEGCEHGFAVRGDMNNPQVKAGKEGAFKATLMWVKRFL